jgi:glycosyltransferase involved in cell wall biosynthesis
MQPMGLEYVLITPARNEVSLIGQTLESVIAQSILPKRWVIVSDGSTDGTDELVRSYMVGRDWIELVHLSESRPRSFAAKVQVFNAGYNRLKGESFDVLGNLDADISFGRDYFEFLLGRFAANADLGVAGTHYIEDDFHSFDDSNMSPEHVNGGCQLFRRQCFESIGGYVEIPGGGVDWVAVTTARMKGWETRSFGERVFYHHRKIGTAGTNQLVSRFRYGSKDYYLGGHPLWEILRGAFQMTKAPYVVGGLSLLAGYCWSAVTRANRPISDELMRFHRREQFERLKRVLRKRTPLRGGVGMARSGPVSANSKQDGDR